MKLQVKLALYNAISKAAIILAIGALMPMLIEKVVYDHMDKRLVARLDKTMKMVAIGGLDEIALDQDCSFDNYNIFKEEFVRISPISALPPDFNKYQIENADRLIGGEIVRYRLLTQAFLYDNQLYMIEIGEGVSAIDQLNMTIRKFSILMMLAVVVISIFLDFGFARLLLRPFNKIVRHKLKNVRHPLSYDYTPVKSSTTEFAQLDNSINEMMQKLKETFEMEREFITNVSHEILTPISILKNRLENLINDAAVPDHVIERMIDSQKTLSRLTKVVRSLLYISKIENAQFVRNETADLNGIIRDILEEMEEWIQSKEITVVNEWKGNFIFAPSNKSLIHTMLSNLISNAVKYNKPQGKITIEGDNSGNFFILKISDTGVGIDKEQLPFIFDRFKRFRPEDEMSYGLGLPIVKTIADFHEIEISAESNIGVGTVFSLKFKSIT
ncbi:MAG: HAMP domain-containing sensor histidine kinase [Bacteroidia bacterium]